MPEFILSPNQFEEGAIAPNFQELVPGTGANASDYSGTLPEFTYMNDVRNKKSIINFRRTQNLLQRRDASCDLIYKQVAGASTRQITVDELYAATKHCKHEFYKGCLKDWKGRDPLFGQKIIPFFRAAVGTDIVTNAYFGDIARPESNGEYSTNKFDGIFKWFKKFLGANLIKAAQTVAAPVVDLRDNPTIAYQFIKALYDRQTVYMRNVANNLKAFYVSQAVADGYQDYLLATGNGDATTFAMYANGVTIKSYKGIPIMVEPTWEPVAAELGYANFNAAILTLRGNFVFGTDKDYGEDDGTSLEGNNTTAVMTWYEKKEMSWYYQMFLKAGTAIGLPEHSVLGLPTL